MKNWRGLALAACLLLSGCGAEHIPAPKEPVQEDQVQEEQPVAEVIPPVEDLKEPLPARWQTAYAAFLEAKVNEAVWFRDPENPNYDPNWVDLEAAEVIGRYFLYDIDKDGLPELLIRYGAGEAGYHTTVYGYVGDAVTELGDMPSGHSSFYTWPGENGIARNWGHMGGHFVEKISLVDGELHVETIFEEGYAAGEEEVVEYTAMGDIVYGSSYLWETRPTVSLPEAGALTLPVYDYGTERIAQPLDPERDEAAKAAIEFVLTAGGEFYGVTADGYGGDTGWTTMETYLQPGSVTVYADRPLEIMARTWEDFNHDGQSEALVTIQHGEGDPYGGMLQVVFSWQDNMVYGYCLNYMDSYDVEGTVFVSKYDDIAFSLAFDGFESYEYTIERERA